MLLGNTNVLVAFLFRFRCTVWCVIISKRLAKPYPIFVHKKVFFLNSVWSLVFFTWLTDESATLDLFTAGAKIWYFLLCKIFLSRERKTDMHKHKALESETERLLMLTILMLAKFLESFLFFSATAGNATNCDWFSCCGKSYYE